MKPRSLIRVAELWLFVGCVAMVGAPAIGFGQTLDELLAGLDDDDPEVRETSSAALLMRLCDDATIYPHVRDTANMGPSLEAKVRAQNIIADWIAKNPLVGELEMAAGLKVSEILVDEFGTTAEVLMFGCDLARAESPGQQALLDKWSGLRGSVNRADIPGAIDKANQLQMCLENLSDAEIAGLGFEHLNPDGEGFLDSDRDFLLAKIQAAQQILVQLGLQLYSAINPGDTVLAALQPVTSSGAVQLGQTLALTLTNVVQPGQIETLWPADATRLFAPRPGFETVGPAFFLQAAGGLSLAGPIGVTIDFGGPLALGEVQDAADLRIVRFDGRHATYLPTAALDAGAGTITAFYNASPTGNALGEFYLVNTPEPSAAALMFCGAAAMSLARVRRRFAKRRARDATL